MPSPQNVYQNCDVLEKIPPLNRENWLFEIDLIRRELAEGAKVLQVGSMDGTRITRLLAVRPDLHFTGLEIEKNLVHIAQSNIAEAGLRADFIHGDITNPPTLPSFDYVLCLNNTLGYIPEEGKAIEGMKKLGKVVIISVYGERFDDVVARAYFESINLKIKEINGDKFMMQDFTNVKRYTQMEVESWGGRIVKSPIGYLAIMTVPGN